MKKYKISFDLEHINKYQGLLVEKEEIKDLFKKIFSEYTFKVTNLAINKK